MIRSTLKLGALCAALALSSAAVAHDGGKDCKPSRWGKDDQVGNANYITPEKTLAASKLITRGKAYRLGIETNRATPAYPPRNYAVTILQPGQVNGVSFGPTKLSYNDDIVMGWNGVGSQLDGFGHIGNDGVYYNCVHAEDFANVTGLKKFGIETVPAIATKVIVLDMVALHGKDGMVAGGVAFNKAEIEAAMKRQGVKSIDKGDVVLFHTGWLHLIGKDNNTYNTTEPGLGKEGALYLAEKGVAAVGADSWGLEVVPFEKGSGVFEVHQILIKENGIYILENMDTSEMVKDGVSEAFFTLGPSRLSGAVQAIINPIAVK